MDLLKNISVYTFINFGVKAFGIVVLPIIAKNLSVEEFGFYVILLSVVSLSENFLLFGFEHSLNYFFYNKDVNQLKLVSTQLFFLVIVSIIFILIIYPLFHTRFSNLLFILLWIISSLLLNFLNILMRVRFDVKYFLITSMIKAIVFLGLIYLLIVIMGYKLQGIILSNFFSITLILIILLYHNRKLIDIVFSISLLKKIFVYGAALIPVGFIFWASTQMDRYFILYFFDNYILGIYGFALTIGLLPNMLKSALKSALEPYIMKAHHSDNKNTKEIISSFFTANLLLFSAVCLFIALFSKELVVILGSEKFIDSSKYIPLITLIVLVGASNQFFTYGINFAKKNKLILQYLIYTVLLNFVLSIILLNLFSIFGLIISNLLSGIFYAFLLYRKSIKLMPVRFFNKSHLFLFVSFFLALISILFPILENNLFKTIIFIVFILINKALFLTTIREIKLYV